MTIPVLIGFQFNNEELNSDTQFITTIWNLNDLMYKLYGCHEVYLEAYVAYVVIWYMDTTYNDTVCYAELIRKKNIYVWFSGIYKKAFSHSQKTHNRKIPYCIIRYQNIWQMNDFIRFIKRWRKRKSIDPISHLSHLIVSKLVEKKTTYKLCCCLLLIFASFTIFFFILSKAFAISAELSMVNCQFTWNQIRYAKAISIIVWFPSLKTVLTDVVSETIRIQTMTTIINITLHNSIRDVKFNE